MIAFNAIAFSLFGLVMGFLPALFPGYFPPTGNQGSSTSALWLEFMGSVQGALGLFFCGRDLLLPTVRRILATRIVLFPAGEQPQPGTVLRPLAMGYLRNPQRDDQRLAA